MTVDKTECGSGKCCCPCHKMLGILIALFGLTFLLKAFEVLTPKIASITWPIIVILIGLSATCKGSCKCCNKKS